MNFRIGHGIDTHPFDAQRPLILGGVLIPDAPGLMGYSDADVLLHALCDALLGAAALGDLGRHFPSGDVQYKNCSSRLLLERVYQLINEQGYRIGNIDCTVIAEKPRLANYIDEIRTTIANDLKCDENLVSVKATTSDGLGYTGRGEGICAHAVVLIYRL
jgi:2-C-methyl-D-erythritol 2,4-cyclodiphosphate synthase